MERSHVNTSIEVRRNVIRKRTVLLVGVITRSLADPKLPETFEEIDYNNKDKRDWFDKHCYWAMRHNMSVTTYPLEEEE